MPVVAFNQFYGGISDDPFVGPSGSFADNSGVDIRTELRGVRNNRQLVQISPSWISWLQGRVNKILSLPMVNPSSADSYLISFWDDGHIWRFTYNSTYDFQDCYTDADTTTKNGIVYNNRVYWVGSTHVRYIALTDVDENAWAGFMTTLGTAMTNTEQFAPMIVAGWFLYIGNGNNLVQVDNTTLTNGFATLQTGDKIVSMTFNGTMLSVYTVNQGVNIQYSRKYMFDLDTISQSATTGNGATAVVELGQDPVSAAVYAGDVDYAIAGVAQDMSIYVSQGYQFQRVKNITAESSVAYQLNWGLAYANDVLYIAGDNANGTMQTYGSKTELAAKSLSNDFTTGWQEALTAVEYLRNKIFVWFQSGSGYGIYLVDLLNGAYNTTGTVDMPIFYGSSFGIEKALLEIWVTCSTPGTSNIEISYDLNRSGTFIPLTSLSGTATRHKITPNLITWGQNFFMIQFRATLNKGWTEVTPILYEISARYNEIEN